MHRAVGALRLWTVVSDCLVVSHVWFRALTEYGSNCAAPAPVVCLVSSTPASLGPGSPPVFSDSEPWLHIRFTQEAFEMPSEALPPTMEPRVVAWGCSVGPQVLVRAEKHLLTLESYSHHVMLVTLYGCCWVLRLVVHKAFPLSLNCVPSVRHNYATTAILWTERRDEDWVNSKVIQAS